MHTFGIARRLLASAIAVCLLVSACARTVYVQSTNWDNLDNVPAPYAYRITLKDGTVHDAVRMLVRDDFITVLELAPHYDRRNEARTQVPFTIPRDQIASIDNMSVDAGPSLAIVGVIVLVVFGSLWLWAHS
jgi:hypothetical protein